VLLLTFQNHLPPRFLEVFQPLETMSLSRSGQLSPPKEFLSLWLKSNRENGPRNYFSWDKGRIIGKVSFSQASLIAEHAWLSYLHSQVDRTRVEIPHPIGSVVEDSGYFCLYLKVIPGQTLVQWINVNGTLTDELARKVTDAYVALRAIPPSPNQHIIPGGLEWPVMGQIFNEDNDAECVVSTRNQFYEMMDERFRVAIGPHAKLPRANIAFSHGDISPTNVILTPDNRIAFLDFGMSAWLPEYWDAYNLSRDQYITTPGFLDPIRKAFAAKGVWMDDNDPTRSLLQLFDSWSKSEKGRQYLR
jgi:hypothetical protein